jgi:hypothetical protein
MSIPAIMVAADPPRGAAVMASLLLSVVDANEDEESAVEDVTGAWVVDTNAVPEPWRRLPLLLAVLRTGLNEYAEP